MTTPMKNLDKIRKNVADLYCASGCSCCRDNEEWERASNELANLLNIPEYDDGLGYDFYSVRDDYQLIKE